MVMNLQRPSMTWLLLRRRDSEVTPAVLGLPAVASSSLAFLSAGGRAAPASCGPQIRENVGARWTGSLEMRQHKNGGTTTYVRSLSAHVWTLEAEGFSPACREKPPEAFSIAGGAGHTATGGTTAGLSGFCSNNNNNNKHC